MTGWHLTVGYQYDTVGDEWLALRDEAKELQEDLAPIADRAGVDLEDAAAYFGSLSAVTFHEHEPEPTVMLLASGGSPGREIKEKLARAFILLLLGKMAELEINISVSVV